MSEYQYLTLLRGINVGGNNIIKMSDLKMCCESMGFSEVQTYIQSGNVIFRSGEKDRTLLTDKIEQVLSARFSYSSRVVILTYEQLKKVIKEAPSGFGKEPEKYRYDVLFVKEPVTPENVMKNVSPRAGIDEVSSGESVLYFSRLISRASQSYLTKIISLPVYKDITVRNWNTSARLYEIMEQNNSVL